MTEQEQQATESDPPAQSPAVEPEAVDGVHEEPEAVEPPAPEPEPDYKDKWLRSEAELDNVRKRARRDVSAAESRGVARLAKELLPALDNLERALAAAEAQPENRDHHLTDGIRLVQNELLSGLGYAVANRRTAAARGSSNPIAASSWHGPSTRRTDSARRASATATSSRSTAWRSGSSLFSARFRSASVLASNIFRAGGRTLYRPVRIES